MSDRGARAASRADAAFGMLMSMAAGEIVGGVAKVIDAEPADTK